VRLSAASPLTCTFVTAARRVPHRRAAEGAANLRCGACCQEQADPLMANVATVSRQLAIPLVTKRLVGSCSANVTVISRQLAIALVTTFTAAACSVATR
jgi:hypothetical protein